MRDSAHCSGIEHDLVCIDERILVYMAEDVTSGNMISELGAGSLSSEAVKSAGCERRTLTVVGEKSHWMLRSRASVLMPLGM
jgi:hypothetical protein